MRARVLIPSIAGLFLTCSATLTGLRLFLAGVATPPWFYPLLGLVLVTGIALLVLAARLGGRGTTTRRVVRQDID